MGALNPFKKPPKPDTSALRKQEERLAEQEKTLEAEKRSRQKKEDASRRAGAGRSGKRSLLTGFESGVTPVNEEKKKVLG